MPLYSDEETHKFEGDSRLVGGQVGGVVNVPRLMLNQMRWINCFLKPDDVARQLLETSSVMQPQVRRVFCSTWLLTGVFFFNEKQPAV